MTLEIQTKQIVIDMEMAQFEKATLETNRNYLKVGASAKDALLLAKNQGACLENPKRESSATHGFEMNFAEYIKSMHRMNRADQHLPIPTRAGAQFVAISLACHLESRGVSVAAQRLTAEIEAIAGKEADEFLETLLDTIAKECNPGHRLPQSTIPEPIEVELKSQAELDTFVRERFMPGPQKRLPFSLAICGKMLAAGPKNHGLNDENLCFEGDAHSVTVIGSRWNPTTRQCFLKVKNSWGTSCGDISPAWKCKGGILSIDTHTLSRNTYSATYLPPPR
jgi:hypothetical protein